MALLGLTLVLSGCESAADKAKHRYDTIKAGGETTDLCDAAKRVASAYADAGDTVEYSRWKTRAVIDCAQP